MAQFYIHGKIVEEPRVINFQDSSYSICLKVEESFGTYDIYFNGPYADNVPKDINLSNRPVVITGYISSKELKDGISHAYAFKGTNLLLISWTK